MSDLPESTVHDTSELYLALILSDHFVSDRRLQLPQMWEIKQKLQTMQFTIHIANSKCSKPHSNMMHPATCMILMILVILIFVVLG